ncbi:hypothetical protein LTR56_001581 [Elasticomyces elasticus]|nr:hypothetical protein LTR56_001581 [Elasticomyces elasticus]KAK3667367.1 hypothetical protein LTR22_001883 [Elasticomyces elasticus]KAK4932553.1 hypothetical protein LTR49_000977 [Elasticomyces elasticus]KAK5769575.1 hypothetical protein LTS12_000025 [Elasticomyces elasticus]
MDRLGISIASAAIGVASHVLYFNRFECHMHGVLYMQSLLASWVASTLYLTQWMHWPITEALAATSTAVGCFLGGVYGSLLFYRLFLNPLNRFPGPWSARLSSFFLTFRLGNLDAYLQLQALHRKYGSIVRIGSSQLSVIDPEGMEVTYGVHATATKAAFYDGDKPLTSMQTARSKDLHDRRRKIWAPAFSDRAVRAYETTIHGLNDKIVKRFSESVGTPVNVSFWFNLYSFDAMGSLAFGKDYRMLDSGERHQALQLLHEGMQPLGYLFPLWFFRMVKVIPGLASGIKKFEKFSVDELGWRVEHADRQGGQDIMSWLLKPYLPGEKPQEDPLLQADTRLIIVAGDPSQVTKLREELRALTQGDWSDKDIRHAPHLNGAINEALRLHPPVPSGLPRLTPPEGMRIGEIYIPGSTTFIMPQFVMGRDESSYEQPNDFVPERWYGKPEMVKRAEAYAPFSMGPYNCIGKNLALTELRTLTARLVLEFDVKLAPGQEPVLRTRDHFTVDISDLNLVFAKA